MSDKICSDCGHVEVFHLNIDGPQPRCCNFPKCRCDAYIK